MVRQAEEAREKDAQRKAFVEAKNDADALIYSSEKSLAEYKVTGRADLKSGSHHWLEGG